MTDLKRLMVCSDLSAPARHAASRAASVARETGAELELVHVASPAPLDKLRRIAAHLPAGLEARWLQAARTRLDELAATLQREHGIVPTVHVATGAVPGELTRRSEERGADLLVLGARGEGFMRHLLLGATAERMVGRATRPMLIVKQAAHRPYRSALVAVDFSPSSLEAVRLARSVAPKAAITVLHAFEVPFEGQMRFGGVEPETIDSYRIAARQEAMHALHALCDEAGVPPAVYRPIVMHGNPVLRVLEQEQEQDADLIVVGKHGENAFETFLLGSVTRELLSRSQADVLVSVGGSPGRL
jgi:universal stress protein E